ncbi:unnamed protein product [Spirodela intermedia]|uniref:Uncharacterized protein n=1 Tax=Spirodela intermedia TaxID=51605 RepID=A0A7I8L726_SPIIN|nr:unnamed protein product [Spirodela intermedia]
MSAYQEEALQHIWYALRSHSEEHLPPPSYHGCWHGVSQGFFLES